MNFFIFFLALFFLFSGKDCSKSISIEEAKNTHERKSILRLIQKTYTDQNIKELMILKLIFSCNPKDISTITQALNSEYSNVKIAAIEWLRLCTKPNDEYIQKLFIRILKENEKDTQVLIYILDALKQSNHPQKNTILKDFLKKNKGNQVLENWINHLLMEHN